MSLRDPASLDGPGADNRCPEPLFAELDAASASDPLSSPEDLSVDWSSWRPPAEPGPAVSVTAVLVAHDGATFLPRTLDALEAQTRRPDRLVAADTGSSDHSADMLAIATPDLVRLGPQAGFGEAVGAALAQVAPVTSAKSPAFAAVSEVIEGHSGPVEWLWLLHDDSAPAPDTLQRLIETVDAGPSIGIAGCKQVSWADGRRLLDVGFTTSRFGARVTGVDVDDIDQGQLDHRSDVLAVGTSGMLVRRDLWDRLGGPDPALPNARLDLDLCRRAHLRGERVVVVPQAVMAHAEATSSGLRAGSKGPTRASSVAWARRDRVAAVHLRLVSVALPVLPLLVLWLGVAAVLRALARLTLKQPDRAMAEIGAYLLAVFRPAAWIRARWRARKGRTMSRREYRRLLAGLRPTLRQRRDRLSSYLRAQEEAWAEPAPAPTGPRMVTRQKPAKKPVRAARSGKRAEGTYAVRRPRADELIVDLRSLEKPAHPLDDPTADEPITPGPVLLDTPDGDETRFDDERDLPPRRASLRIGLSVALLTGVAGLLALRVFLRGSGVPVGDALIPAPATAGQLWSLGLTSWRPTGLGVAAAADPFDLVLALISGPFAGSTRVATSFLLIAALPLAALSAWWAAAALTRSRALRAWAALVWAAAPSLILSVTAGRLGAIVAHLMLPLTALALTRAVGLRPIELLGPSMPGMVRRRRASMASASAAGLALTVLIAAAPALALPSLLVVLTLLFVAKAGRRLLVWTLVVPAVLLAPWWQAVAQDLRLLLAEPGGASAVRPGSPGWAAALWPADPAVINHGPVHRLARVVADLTGFADPGVWLRVFAVVVVVPPLLLGLLALNGHRRRRVARMAWLVGLIALVTAVAIPVFDTRQSADGLLHGWSGPAVSLFLLALLVSALSNLDGAAGRLRSRSIGIGHWSAVAMGALAVLTPMLVLTSWAADGWTGSPNRWVHRADPEVLPAVAAAEADGPAATRTLTLQATRNGVRWTLYRTGGPQIGQESAASLTPSAAAARSAGDEPVLETIGALLSASGEDQRERFADLDIGSVLLLTNRSADGRSDATDDAVAALDVAPGLVRVSSSDGKMLWRVELAGVASDTGDASGDAGTDGSGTSAAGVSGEAVPTRPARVRVLSENGDLITTVPAPGVGFTASLDSGNSGRLLVLSERADPGWTATLNGTELARTTYQGWAQAFRLPVPGGTLAVRHDESTGNALDLTRIGVLALALLVAVPLPRRRLRLLIPQKGWRPQQPPLAPVGSTGRRVRRPGDAPDRSRRAAEDGADGGDAEELVPAYADHQARMTELARRLAIESAEDEDPMTARPSRRRRRAARQAAEAMAAEATAAETHAAGAPSGSATAPRGEGTIAGARASRGKSVKAVAAQGTAAEARDGEAQPAVGEAEETEVVETRAAEAPNGSATALGGVGTIAGTGAPGVESVRAMAAEGTAAQGRVVEDQAVEGRAKEGGAGQAASQMATASQGDVTTTSRAQSVRVKAAEGTAEEAGAVEAWAEETGVGASGVWAGRGAVGEAGVVDAEVVDAEAGGVTAGAAAAEDPTVSGAEAAAEALAAATADGAGAKGAGDGSDGAQATAPIRVPPQDEVRPTESEPGEMGSASVMGPVEHAGPEPAREVEAAPEGTAGEVTGVPNQLENRPGTGHALRPGRAESTLSLPPGPRASKENSGPGTPVEPGDSASGESAQKPASPGDSEGEDPRSGDAASPDGKGETFTGPDRPQDVPGDSGEDESS